MHDAPTFSFYCQEPIHAARREGLRVGAIADGNGRRGHAGYAAGARNVVRCAEHCLRRGDVDLFCAIVLSPENVQKRGQRFFATMHALFIRLVTDVIRGRALVGVRCELYGTLDGLKKRGGAARRLAHTIELLLSASDAASPGMRLVLAVDYDEEIVAALHLDLLVRTGVESSSVIRLSGLRSHPSAAYVATTKLWCELDPRDLDEAIAALDRTPPAPLTHGYGADFVAAFVEEILRADIPDPLRITLPVAAPRRALEAALARLEEGALGAQDRLSVLIAPHRGSTRFGAQWDAPQSIVLLPPAERRSVEAEGPYTAVLAPGQPSSIWRLADLPLGYASVHRCAATPRGLVDGVLKAIRFHADHPPLLGGERDRSEAPAGSADEAWPAPVAELVRVMAAQPRSSAAEIARTIDRTGGSEIQRVADVFVARELAWAISRGLLPADAHWKRAALNYCYTGLAIPFRVPSPSDPVGSQWEMLARHLTRFMLVVAAGDEEITDRVYPGETAEDRRARLEISASFLANVLVGEAPEIVPDVRGAEVLAAMATHLDDMWTRFAGTSHARLFDGFRRAISMLFTANLDELSPAVTANPLVQGLASSRSRASASVAIDRRYAAQAPAAIADRLRALLDVVESDHDDAEEARRAIRVLCYLTDVAASIGAGATFRAAALWTPAEVVTDAMVVALDRAATLADYRFRLANDLSDLSLSADRDRDAKENAWTILIPKSARGRDRERALVRATVTCDEVTSWLDEDLRGAIRDLDAVWPSMAAMIRRGIHVGGRFYAQGHYADLSRQDVGAILDEVRRADGDARAPATIARLPRPAHVEAVSKVA